MKTICSTSKQKIFINGTIYLDPVRKVQNLFVNNGTVQAFNVMPKKFPEAEIIDLEGGTAYPGFIDSHQHPIEVGLCLSGADLTNCNNADSIADSLREFLKDKPDNSPIIGGGFVIDDYTKWSLKDLEKIDNAVGSRPFLALDRLGHNFLVNSTTIQRCNITSETTVPLGGKILLQNGVPTGILQESAMSIAGNKIFQLFNDNLIRSEVKKILNKWVSMGYTSLVAMMGSTFGRIMKPEIFFDMEKDNELPLRVNYMYTFFKLNEIDNALEFKNKNTNMVSFGGLKLFVDTAYTTGKAWTAQTNLQGNNGAYCVFPDDQFGEQYNINRIIEKADNLNLNIHYHAQGDQAIQTILDALENLLIKKGKINSIHTLIHLALLTERQISQIKSFGKHVITTVQPAFWSVQGDMSKYYGNPAKNCYPVKKLMDANISTGISTDYWTSPLEYCSPTKIMNISMTGAGNTVKFPPLTMRDLLNGFGTGSAAVTTIKNIGILDIGYNADMVVFNEDLYSLTPQELNGTYPKVLSTWVGGRKVYKS